MPRFKFILLYLQLEPYESIDFKNILLPINRNEFLKSFKFMLVRCFVSPLFPSDIYTLSRALVSCIIINSLFMDNEVLRMLVAMSTNHVCVHGIRYII